MLRQSDGKGSLFLINKMFYSPSDNVSNVKVTDDEDATEYSMYSEARIMNRLVTDELNRCIGSTSLPVT